MSVCWVVTGGGVISQGQVIICLWEEGMEGQWGRRTEEKANERRSVIEEEGNLQLQLHWSVIVLLWQYSLSLSSFSYFLYPLYFTTIWFWKQKTTLQINILCILKKMTIFHVSLHHQPNVFLTKHPLDLSPLSQTQKHTPDPGRSTFGGWGQASGMKLTSDLQGTIARVHPNQLDNETWAVCSVCLHACTYIFLCLRFVWFVCVLMFFWCMFAHVCDYTEKLDLPPVLQRDRGRAACYRRQITKQYWSGRGHALTNPVFGGFLQTLITSRRLPYPGLISH